MKLSIIVPSYRRPEILRMGLLSITQQNIKHKFEVIVINDGLMDGTAEVCSDFAQLDIKYIFSGQRNLTNGLKWRCPSFAYNIGIKKAQGDIVLLTSPEIYYLTPNCLNNMLDSAISDKTKKKIIAPSKGYDDQIGKVSEKVFHGESIDIKNEQIASLNVQFPFCLMLYKQILLDIGGYDEDFIGYCYDDNDIISRLHTYGCTYTFILNEKILHLFHGKRNKREGLENSNKRLQQNKKLFEDKKHVLIRNVGKEWGVL